MATKIILLDKGKIQQVGKPEDFYNKPENLFVAGFIGSPTMNIFKGRIKDGHFVKDTNFLRIKPNEKDMVKLQDFEGEEVYMGIRSERFFDYEEEKTNKIEVKIEVIEMLGKEQTIYSRMEDGTEIVVTQPGYKDYKVDQVAHFSFDDEALHFFDGESGIRIN